MNASILTTIDYQAENLKSLLKYKTPVKIQHFQKEKNHSTLNQLNLLKLLSDFSFAAAQLNKNVLHLNGKDALQLHLIKGKDFYENVKLFNDYYISEPITNLPTKVRRLIEYPFKCNQCIWFKSRLWLGRDLSRTPLHQDIPFNLIYVTEGIKDIILISPKFSNKLYRYSVFSKSPNFSRVDIRNANYETYSKLKGVKLFKAQVSAGEMILIPPFWWHDVENKTNVTSLNFWFAPFGKYSLLAATAYALKKILDTRQKPLKQL